MKFGNVLNALSAILCLIAVLLEIVVFIYVKNLALYGDDSNEADVAEYRTIQLRNLQSDQSQVDGDGEGNIKYQFALKSKQ